MGDAELHGLLQRVIHACAFDNAMPELNRERGFAINIVKGFDEDAADPAGDLAQARFVFAAGPIKYDEWRPRLQPQDLREVVVRTMVQHYLFARRKRRVKIDSRDAHAVICLRTAKARLYEPVFCIFSSTSAASGVLARSKFSHSATVGLARFMV